MAWGEPLTYVDMVYGTLQFGGLYFKVSKIGEEYAWVFDYDDYDTGGSFRTSTARTLITPNQDINFVVDFTDLSRPFAVSEFYHDTDKQVVFQFHDVNPQFFDITNEGNGDVILRSPKDGGSIRTYLGNIFNNGSGTVVFETTGNGNLFYTAAGSRSTDIALATQINNYGIGAIRINGYANNKDKIDSKMYVFEAGSSRSGDFGDPLDIKNSDDGNYDIKGGFCNLSRGPGSLVRIYNDGTFVLNEGAIYLGANYGEVKVENHGNFAIKPNGVKILVDGGNVDVNNHGTLSLLGDETGFAIDELQSSYGGLRFENYGELVFNNYSIGKLNSAESLDQTKSIRVYNAGGVIKTEAGFFFDGSYEDLDSVSEKPVEIVIISDGNVTTTSTDSYKQFSGQDGNLVLKDSIKTIFYWVNEGSGSEVIFTDIVDGTKLAGSIKSQFQELGAEIKIEFSGTGSGTGSGSGSSTFNMDVVNALISEGKLAAGSVVTSEALTHTDKAFTLGNTGDMTQDTGFMGIKGSTGITVKDGKTLTLMGSQASMAMAVGADTRDASYVITDAPMALENGTLKLGHKALSATEGTLAAVTYDRQSSVNVENGIFSIAALKGEGSLNLSSGTRTDVTGELSATQVTNAGTLTVAGLTSLGATPEAASTYAAPRSQTFVNANGATANLTGGLVVNDFAKVSNKTGSTMNAGAVVVDTFGQINNYAGATLTYASVDADGIVRNQGTLNVTGTYVVGDEGETTLDGESTIGTLAVGRTSKRMLLARNGDEAEVFNRGKTYVDELDLVSGTISVEKDSVLAGKSLKNGAVGSDITVAAGGTFAFSHNKSSLDNALKNFTGDKDGKAILALSTDLHFGQGGSLTVGSVDEAKGTVNLGSDALLLLGTTQLHGEALLNGESSQHLHVEDGAVIAMTDDLLWGNHYLMKGFDDASTAEILKVGILDKDGKALGTKKNDKGIFVTVGSDNILEKDKSYRMLNQMNWLLDGRQDLTSEHGDVAFLTSALVDKHGASATNRMEALAMDAGVMAETQRMGAQVQTTMLDHASSARKGYGTFWVDGIYSKTDSGDFARSTGASAYEADTTGFAFGADLPLGDDSCRLGVAFSAQRGDLNGNDGLSSDIEGYGFSVYGGKTFESGLNVTGALTYMAANHEVSEYNLGRVKADIDADMWTLGARVSMPFVKNRLWMTPYLGAEVMKVKQDAFTSSWSGMSAFHHGDVDATIFRTPVGVKAGTFMPLELLGRSGTLNWDADLSFVPQFGDKDADYRVSGVSNGHTDGMTGDFVNDWLTTAKLGFGWQGAAGAFGIHYAVEKGDVRDWSSSVTAKASLFF